MAVYAQPGTSGALVEFKPRYDNWIGGEWVPPVKGEYFENITPVTGKVFTEVARSTAEDIEVALDAAHKAAPTWNKTTPAERAVLLNKIADRIEENLEMLAVAETWDNGKAIREPLAADLPLAVDHFRYFAGTIRAQEGGLSQIDEDTVAYHFHEPLGVVGQIIPWNFPILMGVWKLAPALAAGNCVVLKPAEQTPVSILVLIELLADILPPGVVNIVNGFGAEAGKPLASSPRIAKIAFTGETTTGRLIMQYASQNIIPVTLELGGKSASIVLDDAELDLETIGNDLFVSTLVNNGQTCFLGTRVLAPKSRYGEVVDALTAFAGSMAVGDSLDPATQIGPMATQTHLGRVEGYIEKGRAEGGRITTGGGRPEGRDGGWFVSPTVFADVNNSDTIAREEIFGPVLSVIQYDDDADAVRIANESEYGLGGTVWSSDPERARNVASRVNTGTIGINRYIPDPVAPFGGVKHSGMGRELGPEGLAAYQNLKSIYR